MLHRCRPVTALPLLLVTSKITSTLSTDFLKEPGSMGYGSGYESGYESVGVARIWFALAEIVACVFVTT